MSQNVAGSDPVDRAVALAPARGQGQSPAPPLLSAEMADLVRAQGGGQPMQVTINVTQITPVAGPAAVVWRACQRVARSPWMPWHPFTLIYCGYKEGYKEAASYPGLLRTIVWIAVATGVAAILWRQWTTSISVLGGLLAFLVITSRTGQLRDVVDALEVAGGLPPILAVLQYAWITLIRKEERR